MKKLLFLLLLIPLLIPSIVFADYVFLVNKTTGKVTDITLNTAKNYQSTLNRITTDKTDCEIQTAEIIKETLSNKGVPVFYLKWDGVKVVEDTVTNIAKEYEASVKEEISIRADIAVIDEMLISSIGAKTTELQKQKAELEAKIAVLENKP